MEANVLWSPNEKNAEAAIKRSRAFTIRISTEKWKGEAIHLRRQQNPIFLKLISGSLLSGTDTINFWKKYRDYNALLVIFRSKFNLIDVKSFPTKY